MAVIHEYNPFEGDDDIYGKTERQIRREAHRRTAEIEIKRKLENEGYWQDRNGRWYSPSKEETEERKAAERMPYVPPNETDELKKRVRSIENTLEIILNKLDAKAKKDK